MSVETGEDHIAVLRGGSKWNSAIAIHYLTKTKINDSVLQHPGGTINPHLKYKGKIPSNNLMSQSKAGFEHACQSANPIYWGCAHITFHTLTVSNLYSYIPNLYSENALYGHYKGDVSCLGTCLAYFYGTAQVTVSKSYRSSNAAA